MSILQEYEQIRKDIGEETFKHIEEYLEQHEDILLSDIYYKEKEWNKFKAWEEIKKKV